MEQIKKLLILGKEIKVEYCTSEEMHKAFKQADFNESEEEQKQTLWGCYMETKGLILINSTIEDEDFMRETLYHEAMHALLRMKSGNLVCDLEMGEEGIVKLMTSVRWEAFKIYADIYDK